VPSCGTGIIAEGSQRIHQLPIPEGKLRITILKLKDNLQAIRGCFIKGSQEIHKKLNWLVLLTILYANS
jgi:hypothetical protein